MLDASRDMTRELRDAFGCFASGVTVVSMIDEGGTPTGITVNSFSSLSLEPALLLFSIGKSQASIRLFEEGRPFNVNVLCTEQEDLAWQFAKPLDDKFAGVRSWEAENGVPVIEGSMAWFVCERHELFEGGDHLIVVGKILEFGSREAKPLVFLQGTMREVAV